MMNRGELEVAFGRNKRCVHDIRYSQVDKKIIDGSPVELETILVMEWNYIMEISGWNRNAHVHASRATSQELLP